MRLTAIILTLILTSCMHNSKEISKVFDNSTIKATLVNGKFDGVVEQTFNEKDYWLKSLSTNWVNGEIKKIVLTDRENINHDMKYFERNGNNNNEVTIYYIDENDSTFKTLPLDDDFLDFCAENAFLSTNTLINFDSIIKIYNLPENYYRLVSSPLPIRLENNAIKVIDNGYKTDSLFVTLYWLQGRSKTEFKIRIEKNVR
jgi:hypothetical protein